MCVCECLEGGRKLESERMTWSVDLIDFVTSYLGSLIIQNSFMISDHNILYIMVGLLFLRMLPSASQAPVFRVHPFADP